MGEVLPKARAGRENKEKGVSFSTESQRKVVILWALEGGAMVRVRLLQDCRELGPKQSLQYDGTE